MINKRKKITALFLLAAMLFAQLDPYLYALTVKAQPTDSKRTSGQSFLPKEFGKVAEEYTAKGKPIFLIADSHADISAQENISRILQFLLETRPVSEVVLEGGEGLLRSEIWRHFPDQKVLGEHLDRELRAGNISGGLHAAILASTKAAFLGIEEDTLYRQNWYQYWQVQEGRQLAKQLVQQEVEQSFKELENTRGAELSQLARDLFENSKQSWLTKLMKMTGNSSKNFSKLDAQAYPQLATYVQILNGKQMVGRVNKINQVLARRYPDLSAECGDVGMGQCLQDSNKGPVINNSYEERFLAHYPASIQKVFQAEELIKEQDALAAWQEFKTWRRNLLERRLASEDAVILDRLEALELAEKLSELKIFSAESILVDTSIDLLDRELKSALKPALNFYQTALQRDQKIVHHLLGQRSANDGEQILVVGGFHLEGIKRILREVGRSYTVIFPSSGDAGQLNYESAMLGRKKPLANNSNDPYAEYVKHTGMMLFKDYYLDQRKGLMQKWMQGILSSPDLEQEMKKYLLTLLEDVASVVLVGIEKRNLRGEHLDEGPLSPKAGALRSLLAPPINQLILGTRSLQKPAPVLASSLGAPASQTHVKTDLSGTLHWYQAQVDVYKKQIASISEANLTGEQKHEHLLALTNRQIQKLLAEASRSGYPEWFQSGVQKYRGQAAALSVTESFSENKYTDLLTLLDKLIANILEDAERLSYLEWYRALARHYKEQKEAIMISHVPFKLKQRQLLELTDEVIIKIFHEAERLYPDEVGNIAMIAAGSYGRKEMIGPSDADGRRLINDGMAQKTRDFLIKAMNDILKANWPTLMTEDELSRGKDEGQRAGEDVTLLTEILDARFVVGNHDLFLKHQEQFRQQIETEDHQALRSVIEVWNELYREESFPGSIMRRVPKIKSGVGGLRAFHFARWITKLKTRNWEDPFNDLILEGVITLAELEEARAAYEYIQRTREIFFSNKDDRTKKYDHMSRQQQKRIANRLGYLKNDQTGERPEEVFMKDYYRNSMSLFRFSYTVIRRIAEDIWTPEQQVDLNEKGIQDVISARMSDYDFIVAGTRSGWIFRVETGFKEESEPVPFILIHGLNPAELARKKIAPQHFLDVFQFSAQHQAPFSGNVLDLLERSKADYLEKLRDHSFLIAEQARLAKILDQNIAVSYLFLRLQLLGILSHLLPGFGSLRAMQLTSDIEHPYTLDLHALKNMEFLDKLLYEQAPSPNVKRVRKYVHRALKYLDQEDLYGVLRQVFLIEKVAAFQAARYEETLASLKPTEREKELIRWMIDNRYLLLNFIRKRGFFDGKATATFIEEGVNSDFDKWNLLYLYTLIHLNLTTPERNWLYENELLFARNISRTDMARPDLLRERIDHLVSETVKGLSSPVGITLKPITISGRYNPSLIEVHVHLLHTSDEPGVLGKISGVFAVHGWNVLSAWLSRHGSEGDFADRFVIEDVRYFSAKRKFEAEKKMRIDLATTAINNASVDSERESATSERERVQALEFDDEAYWSNVEREMSQELDKLLTGDTSISAVFRKKHEPYSFQRAKTEIEIPTKVTVTENGPEYLWLEIKTPLRPGLLHVISEALGRLSLNIQPTSTIDTEGFHDDIGKRAVLTLAVDFKGVTFNKMKRGRLIKILSTLLNKEKITIDDLDDASWATIARVKRALRSKKQGFVFRNSHVDNWSKTIQANLSELTEDEQNALSIESDAIVVPDEYWSKSGLVQSEWKKLMLRNLERVFRGGLEAEEAKTNLRRLLGQKAARSLGLSNVQTIQTEESLENASSLGESKSLLALLQVIKQKYGIDLELPSMQRSFPQTSKEQLRVFRQLLSSSRHASLRQVDSRHVVEPSLLVLDLEPETMAVALSELRMQSDGKRRQIVVLHDEGDRPWEFTQGFPENIKYMKRKDEMAIALRLSGYKMPFIALTNRQAILPGQGFQLQYASEALSADEAKLLLQASLNLLEGLSLRYSLEDLQKNPAIFSNFVHQYFPELAGVFQFYGEQLTVDPHQFLSQILASSKAIRQSA